jgi:hypothetical protein
MRTLEIKCDICDKIIEKTEGGLFIDKKASGLNAEKTLVKEDLCAKCINLIFSHFSELRRELRK